MSEGAPSYGWCAEPEVPKKRAELRARWTILALLCITLFGNYYVYDNPTAVEQQLADRFAGVSGNTTVAVDDDGGNTDTNSFSFKYNLLYSLYSWPNVILPFFGGWLSDRLGVRLMTVVFISLCSVGQLIFAIGCSIEDDSTAWPVMWLGRIIFGFGGESLSVAQSAMLAQWFAGKELAFALGVNLALARVGSVVNDAVSVQIATHFPVQMALWAGFGMCLLSTCTGLASFYLDRSCEDRLRSNLGYKKLARQGFFGWLASRLGLRSGKADGEDGEALHSLTGAAQGDDMVPAIDEPPKEEIHLNSVFKFPMVFWVLTLSCVTVYCDVLPFNNIASGFIAQKWLTNKPLWQVSDADKNSIYVTANSYMLTTYLMAGFLSPLMGGVIDRIGLRAVLNVFAAMAIVGVHAMMAYSTVTPIVPLVLLGICYSIYASALWPSVALVIEPQYHATAYGVVTAVQNLGLAVAPMAIGTLMPPGNCPTYENCVSYYVKVENLLIGLGCAGIFAGLALNWADHTLLPYPYLNWPDSKVQAKKREAGLLQDEDKADNDA